MLVVPHCEGFSVPSILLCSGAEDPVSLQGKRHRGVGYVVRGKETALH